MAIGYDSTLIIEPKTSIYRRYLAFLVDGIPAIPAGNPVFLYHCHLKSSSPQEATEDMEIIPAISAGSVIREGFGKIFRKLTSKANGFTVLLVSCRPFLNTMPFTFVLLSLSLGLFGYKDDDEAWQS
jgi:hypothetical protein